MPTLTHQTKKPKAPRSISFHKPRQQPAPKYERFIGSINQTLDVLAITRSSDLQSGGLRFTPTDLTQLKTEMSLMGRLCRSTALGSRWRKGSKYRTEADYKSKAARRRLSDLYNQMRLRHRPLGNLLAFDYQHFQWLQGR